MSNLNRPSKVGATYVSYQPGRRIPWEEHDHWPAGVIAYWKKQTKRPRYADDLVIYMRAADGVTLDIASIYTRGTADDEVTWGYKIPPGYTTLYVGTCSCWGADMDCTKEDVDWILIRETDPRYVR